MAIQLESETIRDGIGMADISDLLESAKLGDRRSLSMLISAISDSGDSPGINSETGWILGLLDRVNRLLSDRWLGNGLLPVNVSPYLL